MKGASNGRTNGASANAKAKQHEVVVLDDLNLDADIVGTKFESQSNKAQDFDTFKQQYNLKEILDKLVIKREFFIPSKASNIHEFYEFIKEIGEGAYGKVYLAKQKKTGLERAIKLIHRKKIKRFDRFINEVRALKTLDHPNVIKLFEIYEDVENVYLVQEVCNGGELFDRIVEEGHFSEKRSAEVFKQILQAILYTHKNDICHRDLKPENFLFEDKKESALIKLIDFGLSTSYLEQVKDSDGRSMKVLTKLKTCAGTSLYMAPEVIMKQYSSSCDLWSAGVILYIMLAGYPPFYGENDMEVFEKITKFDYDYDDEVWDNTSDGAKDLVSKLLCHVKNRYTAKEALAHPWLVKHTKYSREFELSGDVLRRISTFSSVNKMQQIALNVMAHQCGGEEITESKQIFTKIDKNNDGYITHKEFKEALKGKYDEQTIQQIIRAIDTDKNGAINYTEFIAATLNQDVITDDRKISQAFDVLDKDGDGFIEEKELAQLIGIKDEYDHIIMRRMISEVDQNADNKIDLNEFKRMITLMAGQVQISSVLTKS